MKLLASSCKSPFPLTLLFILFSFISNAQPSFPTDPEQAELYYSDIEHFVEAYQELENNSDTLAVLQTFYFDRATPGLKEFINRHQLTPQMLKEALTKYPDRYGLIPSMLSNIRETEARYKELMKTYSTILPNAMYAPTWLLVDANRGIGQASMVGQLITVERVADNMEKLKKLTTHELTHFQQAMAMGGQKYVSLYSSSENMLGICLREGGAEFITWLVNDDITRTKSLTYIEENEEALKVRFKEDLQSQNKKYWLWDSLDQKDNPGLLGYAIGYKICKAYYDKADDKTQALNDILMMENAEEFLIKSTYFQ
ncbi:hypothetical protein E7Z59_00185 [Robertkochia marina]|uniref:DUF2268 domain-containing protein n=1 Tax=Robertkochia marina TaxID=1227945 RepID=A0A4S3M1C6_9FLAO|nr:DUF2268 domain-containing putative Zn-dependent protease [Robertkochia marina]THD68783.1 hypothetical protein E7Z59_00185 [Robertkochia marina]TRZ43856.1 hypothetical protein D3A96_09835 [Robertkochia marina]